jgi:ribonuclease D
MHLLPAVEKWKTKRLQMSNWEAAPLSAAQVVYAAMDAWAGLASAEALPALKGVEVLGPLQVKATTAADALLSKARVYLGQPRNYGPTEEEIAAKKALEEAEAAEAKRHADEQKAAQARADAAERKRREEHESTRAAEVKQQESELLEVRSIPLRNYLMANVIPTLTEGLIEVCKVKPEDPVDYIAEYLFKNNPQEEESFA